ncbi:carbohydrate ABC transporter permease [Arthrobacter sp. H14-L1]|uniref:carbohydrate ABC transporter permease n=1 Tax=Arthrobacter sp. H14-L1 TaxID=2996697 RepID=UPI00226F18A2|nr:sugar ABC transporter permease [Arthrobacter sp. H14-L1]MCY0906268.1 sugar ABC transporter permease [Arthrobacter sp. H14-L1]
MAGTLVEKSRKRDLRFGLMLTAPSVIIILMLLGYPMGYAIFMSFHQWNDKLGADHQFIGLNNYGQLITDPAVWAAMERTAYFSVITVVGGVALAVIIAILLNRKFRGRTLARVLLLVPWAVPPVVNGIMWKLIFDGSVGIVNTILRSLGLIKENIQWLADPTAAMNILIFAETWKLLPFLCLLMLAALQGIPESIYRAAAIDGADAWNTFWRITLPNIRGPLMFALIVQSMWSLKVFDTIYVLSGGSGGPVSGTTTINFLDYITTFSNLDRGYGSAMAVGIMLLVLIVSAFWIFVFGGFSRKRREANG